MYKLSFFRLHRKLLIILALVGLLFSPFSVRSVLAANPAPLQVYYISLPEDDILQLFDDDEAAGGGNDPVSPIRSVTYISIGTDGTLVYYDQWEDGGYETDIANPTTNVYNAASNPDGTQVWGDGVLGNGCPPNLTNTPNPCLVPGDDVFENGDVIVLDNFVTVSGTTPGPYTRSAADIFFDGRDKFGSSLPVAVARALWPQFPGSVMAGGTEVADTSRWGTQYVAPIGDNTPAANTSAFEDVRWMIMAGAGSATINVDANNDGDFIDANDLNGVVLAEGAKRMVDGIKEGAILNVTAGNAVQVNQMTADVDDTFEFRWDTLVPRTEWTNNYYSPVGTTPKALNSGCTEVVVYNPNAASINVSYTTGGATTVLAVPAGATAKSNNIMYDDGVRFFTTGGETFLPISLTDCTKDTSGTDGRLYDWGNPMFPATQLTPEVLVGWAPGCTDESQWGVCLDTDLGTNTTSRSVVWVTPTAATNFFVDLDGSGIACTSPTTATGAEQTIAAAALDSIRIDNDPSSRTYVHDNFGTVAYNRASDNIGFGLTPAAWGSNWTETGDEGTPGAGNIWITGNALQFRGTSADESGMSIYRSRNLSGQFFSRLSFDVQFAGFFQTGEELAVEISPDGGATWYTLENIKAPASYPATAQLASRVYRTSPYDTANTRIRFRNLGDLEAGDTWSIDEIHIDNAPDGDFDMTGAYIRTCDETAFAAAYGQDPALSGGNDDEAPDLGTGIAPYGARISMTKVASTAFVSPGDLVTYNFTVKSVLNTTVNNVRVVDDLCEPETYISGDDGDNQLEPSETWLYQCTTQLFVDLTNTAYACALLGAGEICSPPDQSTVEVRSAVGDYVWVDEDGDGDQDAGESGIPNVKVTLTGTDVSGGAVSISAYTDANGKYLFENVPPSNASGYTVTVDITTLPAGLAANPTYDENGIGTAHTTSYVLGGEEEHMSADFGYNWAPPTDTNNNTNTGAIGDRVWIDSDGDGLQDPDEPGVYNAAAQLITAGPDLLFGTGDDVVAASTTTNYNGNYIFDGLAAGSYVVRVTAPGGYTQTGDPDSTLDNQTTAPVVLAPGDVYLNADFGYQPNVGIGASIGDTLWVDADLDNTQDVGESVLPSVTVALIRDLDGDGVWDLGEPIIATDVTDSLGQYLFTGLPVTDGVGADDYLVWINDTANVLQGMTATYDSNGASPVTGLETGLGISTVADLAPAGNLTQDFAYVPSGHNAGNGLIGDTVWLDANNNGSYDAGEGMEGVLISLLDNSANVLTRVRTNENGQYFFGGLAAAIYIVQVDYNTLPNGGLGLTNFADPDTASPGNHQSTVSIGAGGINLAQDFGYNMTTPNVVGGTLWKDTNADGTKDAGETTLFSGVTVELYEDTNLNGVFDNADRLVSTKTTDASGNYSFTNLPAGRYFTDVTDDANRLNGYWHILGGTPGADNNSQLDPYSVTVSGGQTNTTGDFGYYRDPASIGDFVWNDLDRDGIQDLGEPGISGAIVTLTVTWPAGGGTTTLTTTTAANGSYSFGNLLLDEDFDGAGAGEPTFLVTFATPETYTATIADQGGNDALDSDGLTEPASPVEGGAITNIDSGFKQVVNIGDTLWYDWNGDGTQDADEPGIPGVGVFLDLNNNGVYNAGIDTLATTDANGQYNFTDLAVDTYRVIVVVANLPGGLTQTGDPDATFNNEHTVIASTPGDYLNVDFGYQGTGSISNYVWNDIDGDATQDGTESGIGGVTVWVDLDNDGVLDATEPYAVTDSNGLYYIGGLPASATFLPAQSGGTYKVRTSGVTGATATYDLDGGGTPNIASVALTAGQNRTDVDWGYQFAALDITKTSNIPGYVNPGQVITYTMVVQNNTLSQHTQIAITDFLPLGTTYAAQSTLVNGFTITPFSNTYADNFDPTQVYNANDGNQNFSGVWIEDDGTQSPTAGDVRIVTDLGDFSLRPGTNPTGTGNAQPGQIYRVAGNLSACTSVTLSYNYRRFDIEPNDHVYLDMSSDGGSNWTTAVSDITSASNQFTDAAYQASGSINVAAYKANLALRFRSVFNDGTSADDVFIDDVLITCDGSIVAAVVKDNDPGTPAAALTSGVPSTLVVAADAFALNPGQSMQVTFQVTVNNPVTLNSINNTASVVSFQQPTPQYASVSDPVVLSTVIGNTVWLDEDGNGYLDAGESGIPNITVQLWNSDHTAQLASTTTDANGSYIFKDIAPGTYQVDVLDSSLPAGLVQTAIIGGGADFTNKADPYTLTVTSGGEYMQADFGYNWAPSADTDGNINTGAIGDRLWIDDGDGVQEPGEPGMYNVPVQLITAGPDGIFGTADDVVAASTTTNYAGNYIFDDLAAGAYIVRVNGGTTPVNYTQTGDPDQFGVPCTTCDNSTTIPILLAPGDVYVNADFGYTPTAGNGYNIGDTLWLDSDRAGDVDAGEPRLAGVSIALIQDLNENGIWDTGEPIIGNDVTDTNGSYLFTNLPVTDGTGTDDYLIWVNDTENILFGLVSTYDSNGAGTPNISAVTNMAAADDLAQDFGYAPTGHDASEGLIGDTIFYDNNGNGTYQLGEGLEGVRVDLYIDVNNNNIWDAGDTLLASTSSSENGSYYFGGLAAGEYVVKIDTTSLPIGVTNTVDPDNGTASQSAVTLAAGEVNLAQDFGYRDTTLSNTISGTVWRDTDAAGDLDGGEAGRFANITIVLRNSSGYVIATTTTDGSGNYSFANLPNGTYTVDVSDDYNLLDGYWKSSGTAPGSDNNSQSDPYTVVLNGSTNNTTADFGYYRDPAALGDYVWLDRNNNGVQEADEPGIPGTLVTLTVTYPNAASVSLSMRTGMGGAYSFGNLLLDEDFNEGGNGAPGKPTYTVSFATPPGASASPTGTGTPTTDSNGLSVVAAPIFKGQTDITYDSGFYTLRLDLGDLPVAYPILFEPGPAHLIFPDTNSNGTPDAAGGVPAVWLGLTIDVELDGQPSVDANGDGLDEDGLALAATGWTAGGSSTATVTINSDVSTTTVYYGLWIDWDNNGSLETFYNGSGVSGSPTPVPFAVSVPGGYVADASVYMRTRASITPLTIADYQGTLINGEVEDYWFKFNGGGVSTPVTLSYFRAGRKGSSVVFDWSTATETGNVGFNLYVEDANGALTQINSQLIPSNTTDSLDRQDYSYTARVKGSIFYLEDVSVLGVIERYGPFKLNEKFGDQLDADKIDQSAIQAENNEKYNEHQDALKQEIGNPQTVSGGAIVATGAMDAFGSQKIVNPTATPGPTDTLKPTRTPRQTATLKPTRTPKATKTPKVTATSSATMTATATATETGQPTATPTETGQPTATPTETGQPTATATETGQPTATPTTTETTTPTATETGEPTATPTSTETATPTATATTEPIDQLTITFNFKVRKTGLYRVTYEMLRDAGLDLAGLPSMNITLINRGQTVPVYVNMQAETFGPGGFIEFYAEALDTIYTDTNIYTLQVSSAPVGKIQNVNAEPNLNLAPPASYTETLVVNNQRAYVNYAPGIDPWYDTRMLAYTTPKSWNFTFQVNELADPSALATLDMVVWGVTDWSQTPDHHLVVSINGVSLENQTFDGLVEKTLKINLPSGTLHEGANTLQLTLPGDTGVNYEIINLDNYRVTYQRSFQAKNDQLAFTAIGEVFNITNLPSSNVVVYRKDQNGIVRLGQVKVDVAGSTFSASFAGSNQPVTYLVTTAEALYTPSLEITRLQADLNHPAQYLIISHPNFIAGLQPLVQARQAQGLTVSVVDVTDLYTQYSDGIFDPQAIKKYIAYAAKNLGTQNVLLVGGDTYDYRNYLGRNSISFIPSLYVTTGEFANFVPADPLYADLDGNNVPDLAIGRFPVRTNAELSLMINKTLAYAAKDYGRTAVFASDKFDGIVSFKDMSNSLAASLPAGWSSKNIHLDDLSVASAQQQLLAAMNSGTALVTFTGHSGPSTWTFNNLFTTKNAAALTNAGRPFVVVQWGCWNTYYVDPVNNYLVQSLLFSGDKGAAAVLGASTLTDSESEALLGVLLTPRLTIPGKPMGLALQEAKTELALTHPELLDVLLGWSLMGDPALVIQQ